MADTILDQIMDQIKPTLETITTANGYETDVVSVYEPYTITGNNREPAKSFSIDLVQGNETRNTEWDAQGNPPLRGWDVPVLMTLYYRPSDNETGTVIRKVLNKFWSDVVKACMTDPQWTDLATDTNLSDPQTFVDDAGFVQKEAILTISYRHYENDPYTQP